MNAAELLGTAVTLLGDGQADAERLHGLAEWLSTGARDVDGIDQAARKARRSPQSVLLDGGPGSPALGLRWFPGNDGATRGRSGHPGVSSMRAPLAIRRGPALLDDAVERQALEGHDGRSGARLERVQLADGSSLILKRMPPGSDLLMRMTSDATGRELALWRAGVLDRLPDGVGHAIVEGWHEADGTVVIAMRDLGGAVLGWHRRLSRSECRNLLGAVTAVHAAYAEVAASISDLCPLTARLRLLWPGTMAREVGGEHPLPRLVVRGWELFADLVPGDIADAIGWVHDDVTRLSGPLSACPLSLVHGDFWLVNAALENGRVVLLDWGAASLAPPALDLACFLVGNATHVDAPRKVIIDDFIALCGDLHEERALKLCLVAALAELGWNKALDIVDHPDPVARGVARDELDWWIAAVCLVADDGLLT